MRGWVVKYKNGKIIAEWEFSNVFRALPSQQDIESVALVWNINKKWIFSNKKHYFEFKTGSMLLGYGGGYSEIISRSIGYWEDQFTKVTWTLQESTGELLQPLIEIIGKE